MSHKINQKISKNNIGTIKGNVQEVERVLREYPKAYDPVEVKDFLMSEKLPDPRPLIYVCDLHGYVEELATYLHNNQLLRYIEVFRIQCLAFFECYIEVFDFILFLCK